MLIWSFNQIWIHFQVSQFLSFVWSSSKRRNFLSLAVFGFWILRCVVVMIMSSDYEKFLSNESQFVLFVSDLWNVWKLVIFFRRESLVNSELWLEIWIYHVKLLQYYSFRTVKVFILIALWVLLLLLYTLYFFQEISFSWESLIGYYGILYKMYSLLAFLNSLQWPQLIFTLMLKGFLYRWHFSYI